MTHRFQAVGPRPSLHALSIILRAEGVWFDEASSAVRVSLTEIEDLDDDFGPAPDTSLFAFLSPGQGWEATRRLGERVFGVSCRGSIPATKGVLTLREGPVFGEVRTMLERFAFSGIPVPLDGVARCEIGPETKVLANIEVEGAAYPALVLKDRHFLATFDLGSSLASLLTETYSPRGPEEKPLSPLGQVVYNAVPYDVRLMLYRVALRRLRRQAEEGTHFTTRTPIDPAGWILSELLLQALDYSLPATPRVWKWPNGCRYAFCFTHDIEPRRYAYYRGLPDLLETLQELGLRSTISVVAEPPFALPVELLKKARAAGHEIILHGLHHDGTFNTVSREERASQIRASVDRLKRLTGGAVDGFRAPWLQRTADLAPLLDQLGVTFDSSLVDTDTSLKRAWHGKGISFNLPFRPFSAVDGGREYQVLELPLTGPQDMEPRFAGLAPDASKRLFERKLDWIRSIGGLYVFLAHAGVYGDRDSRMRLSLLRHLHSLVGQDAVWLARLGDVAAWWAKREGLRVRQVGQDRRGMTFEVENGGRETVSAFSVAIPLRTRTEEARVGGDVKKVGRQGRFVLVPVSELRPGRKTEIGLAGEGDG